MQTVCTIVAETARCVVLYDFGVLKYVILFCKDLLVCSSNVITHIPEIIKAFPQGIDGRRFFCKSNRRLESVAIFCSHSS